MVLDIRYGYFDMLLTGDLGAEGERRLAQNHEKDYDVLKVAHHGSDFYCHVKYLSFLFYLHNFSELFALFFIYVLKRKFKFSFFTTHTAHESRKLLHHLPCLIKLFYHAVHFRNIYTCTFCDSVFS